MKDKKIANLKSGDWITDGEANFQAKKGKFAVARVKGFKVTFDKAIWIDGDKDVVNKENSNASLVYDSSEEEITTLNKKDIKEINELVTKLKVIKGLEDGNKIQEEYDS